MSAQDPAALPTLVAPSGTNAGDPLPAGHVVGGLYTIERMLARGGMGSVYLGKENVTGFRVALKVLAPHLADNAEFVARFMGEANAARTVDNAHVIKIHLVGVVGGGLALPYYAMEHLKSGESLQDRVERGPMAAAEARKPLLEALEALEAVHAAGIVHRDLKPDNIWLESARDGSLSIKLFDFGIAKDSSLAQMGFRTETGRIMGTPFFMSPEQSQGLKDMDHRTDIYAMGAVLYAVFTGSKPPFLATTQGELLVKQLEGPIPPTRYVPTLDPELERLILKCLHANPAGRPQTMSDVRRGLAPILKRLTEPKPRLTPLRAFVYALAGLLTVGGTVLFVLARSHSESAPHAAASTDSLVVSDPATASLAAGLEAPQVMATPSIPSAATIPATAQSSPRPQPPKRRVDPAPTPPHGPEPSSSYIDDLPRH